MSPASDLPVTTRRLLRLSGPAAVPVYEGVVSGAAHRVPFAELVEGMRAANDEVDALLGRAIDADPPGVRPPFAAPYVVKLADVDGALASCDVIGGTAPTRVAAALRAVRAMRSNSQGPPSSRCRWKAG